MNMRGVLIGVTFLGLALALTGVVEPRPRLEADVVARVGERDLRVDDLRRLLASAGALRRDEADLEDTRRLLQALVDEELLVQRAEALGLIDTDPTLRRALQAAQQESLASHRKGRTGFESVEDMQTFRTERRMSLQAGQQEYLERLRSEFPVRIVETEVVP